MQFTQRNFFVEKGPTSNGLHRAPQWLEPALPGTFQVACLSDQQCCKGLKENWPIKCVNQYGFSGLIGQFSFNPLQHC